VPGNSQVGCKIGPNYADTVGYSDYPGYPEFEEPPLDQGEQNSLPTIKTDLSADEIRARLLKLSKRGKLAGYNQEPQHGLVSVAAHGTPFDSELIAEFDEGELRFRLRLLPLMPIVFVVMLLVAIWPGLPLTDAFLSSFEWYARFEANTGILLWYWYLPLTILPTPFAIKSSLNKSRASAKESAIEATEKIGKAISAG